MWRRNKEKRGVDCVEVSDPTSALWLTATETLSCAGGMEKISHCWRQ